MQWISDVRISIFKGIVTYIFGSVKIGLHFVVFPLCLGQILWKPKTQKLEFLVPTVLHCLVLLFDLSSLFELGSRPCWFPKCHNSRVFHVAAVSLKRVLCKQQVTFNQNQTIYYIFLILFCHFWGDLYRVHIRRTDIFISFLWISFLDPFHSSNHWLHGKHPPPQGRRPARRGKRPRSWMPTTAPWPRRAREARRVSGVWFVGFLGVGGGRGRGLS